MLIWMIIVGSISVYATYNYLAGDICYIKSDGTEVNVESALNELYEGVKNNLSKIDKAIAISLDNYPLDRVSYVDRALLRIGTYELIYTDTPTPIIINEIVNLSKDYSEVNKLSSSKFNNGVLDKISKTYRDNGSK